LDTSDKQLQLGRAIIFRSLLAASHRSVFDGILIARLVTCMLVLGTRRKLVKSHKNFRCPRVLNAGFGRLFPLRGRSCGVLVGTLVVLQRVGFDIFREASTNLSLLHRKRWGVDKFWHGWRERGGQEERGPLHRISFLVYSSMRCSPPLQILAYRALSVRCDWLIHSGSSKRMTRSISFWLRRTAGVFFWQGISILWVLNPYGKLSITYVQSTRFSETTVRSMRFQAIRSDSTRTKFYKCASVKMFGLWKLTDALPQSFV
jgi:hypothetical protein